MTRETKIGLVVASSFLCLVGVVIAARLSQAPPEGQNLSPVVKVPPPPVPVEPGEEKKDNKKEKKNAPPAQPNNSSPSGPEALPAPMNPAEIKTTANTDNKNPLPENTNPPIIPDKSVTTAPNNTPDLPKLPTDDSKNPQDDWIKKALAEQNAKAKKPTDPDQGPGGPPAVPGADPKNPNAKETEPEPVFPPTFAKEDKKEKKIEPTQPDQKLLAKGLQDKKGKIESPTPMDDPPPPAFPDEKGNLAQVKNPNPSGPPEPDNSLFKMPAPKEPVNPEPQPVIPIRKDPPGPAMPVNPPVALSKGINPPPAPGGVQVIKTEVESYTVKPEDRTFADISRNIYQNDRYGEALLKFNRDYPGASPGIMQNPPQLKPGDSLFYPALPDLINRYRDVIGAGNPAKNTAPITMGPPAPLNPSPGNPGAVAGPPPGTKIGNVAAPPGTGRTYQVPRGGLHILAIAQNVLGSSQRWSDLYRLNPTIRPEFPIPEGTVLRLP